MHVEHAERGIKYTADELLMIAKKLGRLATYCRFVKGEGSKIRIDAEGRDTKKDRDRVKVSVSVFLPKKTLRAESRKFKALDAVESCMEKLEEQVKAYKEEHTGIGIVRKARRSSKQQKLARELGLA